LGNASICRPLTGQCSDRDNVDSGSLSPVPRSRRTEPVAGSDRRFGVAFPYFEEGGDDVAAEASTE